MKLMLLGLLASILYASLACSLYGYGWLVAHNEVICCLLGTGVIGGLWSTWRQAH